MGGKRLDKKRQGGREAQGKMQVEEEEEGRWRG